MLHYSLIFLIIALIALGLSVIFGLLDIINIAHGDFFMVGTVLAWFSLSATGNFWIGFFVAPLIGFVIGAIIQRLVIQQPPDLGQPGVGECAVAVSGPGVQQRDAFEAEQVGKRVLVDHERRS